MKKMVNTESINGRVFSHDLQIKTVQNKDSKNFGKPFIAGKLNIAVDEDGLNVVEIHYTYVAPTYGSGAPNKSYAALEKIINENRTWTAVGKENAFLVEASPNLDVNDFFIVSDERFVSSKRNESGFISIVNQINKKKERNKFDVDIVINKTVRTEADPERHIDKDYVTVSGMIFNWRNEVMPVDLVIRDEGGMTYFESLEASGSNPVFTRVWGQVNSVTKVDTRTTESAFGPSKVDTFERQIKEYLITGAASEPYLFDDETTITAEELKTALQNRKIKETEVETDARKRAEEKNSKSPAPSVPVANKQKFEF